MVQIVKKYAPKIHTHPEITGLAKGEKGDKGDKGDKGEFSNGDGGVVTQLTSKSTEVTLNKLCGQITTHNEALNAGQSVSFTFSNNKIGENDLIVLSLKSGLTKTYFVSVESSGLHSCNILLYNYSTSNRSDVIVINFGIFKSVIS